MEEEKTKLKTDKIFAECVAKIENMVANYVGLISKQIHNKDIDAAKETCSEVGVIIDEISKMSDVHRHLLTKKRTKSDTLTIIQITDTEVRDFIISHVGNFETLRKGYVQMSSFPTIASILNKKNKRGFIRLLEDNGDYSRILDEKKQNSATAIGFYGYLQRNGLAKKIDDKATKESLREQIIEDKKRITEVNLNTSKPE